jgi:hypothetical protein
MAGLSDIPAALVALKADIANAAYAQGTVDMGKLLIAVGEFGQSIGFKASPDDAKTLAEVETTVKECIDGCTKDKKKAATGAIDWKSLLSAMLTSFLQWWLTRPIPPAPTP